MMCSTSLILSFVLSRELTLGIWMIVFSAGFEHLQHVVGVGAGVEEVADVELLQIFVAVELLVIGVGDGLELRLVLRREHGLGVAAEIGAGHRDDMRAVAGDEAAEMQAELVVGIGGDVMELVDRDQPVVERLDAELVDREAEGRVRADQHLVAALEKRADRLDLAAVVGAGRVAEIPFRLDAPVGPEAVLRSAARR